MNTSANDNTPDYAAVIERLSQANRAWLNAAAIQIREWREEDRRAGVIWDDERIAR